MHRMSTGLGATRTARTCGRSTTPALPMTGPERPTSRRGLPTRRRFLQTLGLGALSSAALGSYAVAIEPLWRLSVTRYAFTPSDWRAGLTLRVAIVADVHACNPWMSADRIESIVARTNALEPDVTLLLGGLLRRHLLALRHVLRAFLRMGADPRQPSRAARPLRGPGQPRLVGGPGGAAARARTHLRPTRAGEGRPARAAERGDPPDVRGPSLLDRRARGPARARSPEPLRTNALARGGRPTRDATRGRGRRARHPDGARAPTSSRRSNRQGATSP